MYEILVKLPKMYYCISCTISIRTNDVLDGSSIIMFELKIVACMVYAMIRNREQIGIVFVVT